MPWDKPKSLSVDEVYAVVAYILNLGDILPADFVLSDRNIADVQRKLPNRDGMTRDHGLWDVKGAGDVRNAACMKNCASEVRLASVIPDHARESHGDLAAQNRLVGPARGSEAKPGKISAAAPASRAMELAVSKACLGCHGLDKRSVGPGLREISARYGAQADAEARLVDKVRRGGSGAWGSISMPPNPDLGEDDARLIVRWILAGAR